MINTLCKIKIVASFLSVLVCLLFASHDLGAAKHRQIGQNFAKKAQQPRIKARKSHIQVKQSQLKAKPSVAIVAKQYPLKSWDGRYFYSDTLTHNHLTGALAFAGKKAFKGIVSKPQAFISYVVSCFVGDNKKQIKEEKVVLNVPVCDPIQTKPEISCMQPTITWIGHASFLIQIGGFNILTDPIFGDVKAGPFTVTPRSWAPGVTLKDLPPIDIILISHNHADHTDKASVMAIYKKNPDVKICVPEGNAALFSGWGIKEYALVEKNWWAKQDLFKNGQEISLCCLPADHWSLHLNPLAYRKALWGSWMISCNNTHIYFAGDTAYHDQFRCIAQEFPRIDVALMPIGPTKKEPGHIHQSHVDARQAIDAFIDLNAHCFIPMHYGVFFRKPETFEYPVNVLHEYWASKERENKLAGKRLLFAQCGKAYSL